VIAWFRRYRWIPHAELVQELDKLPQTSKPRVLYATADQNKVRIAKGWRLDYEEWKRRNRA
jgi:hypothetical protein